jgi:hypothetical protein
LLQAAQEAAVTGAEAVWRCGHCDNTLNREEIENRLLEEVEKKVAIYLMQDFRCAKTHQVTQRLATAFSILCEPLQMDFPPQKMRQHLQSLGQVAQLHQFRYLQEAVAEVLQST